MIHLLLIISFIPLLSLLYTKYNKKLVNRVFQNTYKYIKQENIKTSFLNEVKNKEENVLGTYAYHNNGDGTYDTKNAEIKVLNTQDRFEQLCTLIHEVGHHYYIKNFNDTSEVSANKHVIDTFKKELPTWEYYFLTIPLLHYHINSGNIKTLFK